MKTLAPGVKVTDSALTQIVVRAAEQVVGVRVRRPRRHLDVEVADGSARVALELAVTYGSVLPEVARGVQERVADALGTMCDVTVTGGDVASEELAEMAGSRREARKAALTLLYQWDVTERAPGELYEGEIDAYARDVTAAVVRDAAELDRRITAAAEESGWTADRLGAVERNILRIAIHELDAGDIPPGAVIDEAVTLAKQYSTREAGRLVNGILDRINKEAA